MSPQPVKVRQEGEGEPPLPPRVRATVREGGGKPCQGRVRARLLSTERDFVRDADVFSLTERQHPSHRYGEGAEILAGIPRCRKTQARTYALHREWSLPKPAQRRRYGSAAPSGDGRSSEIG